MEPLTTEPLPSMPLVMPPEVIWLGRMVPEAKWLLETCPLAIEPLTTAPSPM